MAHHANSRRTALLIALCLKRSEQSRARISLKTVRVLSGRSTIRTVFVNALRDSLDDNHGLILTELDRGGYGLLRRAALEGAPAITAAKYVPDYLSKLKQGQPIAWSKIKGEVDDTNELDLEDDDGD